MVLVVVAVLVVLAVVVAVVVRGAAGKARARIDAAVAGLDVVRREKANFYGVASKGATQTRGLGVLVLTPEELVFLQLVPSTELRVPRSALAHVELARSFLGKTQARDLLVVEWTTGEGEEDRAAFDVPQPDEWRIALTEGP
jgi:type II secretory pathway pseudopilin PulG